MLQHHGSTSGDMRTDVVHALPERHKRTHADKGARNDLRHPRDTRRGRPTEPEECAWQYDGSDNPT